MIKVGLGNRFKHRSFEYVPRFYDPVKDELKERIKMYSRDAESEDFDAERLKERIRIGMKMKYRADSSAKQSAVRTSNIRLFLIMIFLTILAVVILQSDKIVRMMEVFTN